MTVQLMVEQGHGGLLFLLTARVGGYVTRQSHDSHTTVQLMVEQGHGGLLFLLTARVGGYVTRQSHDGHTTVTRQLCDRPMVF